MLIVREGAIFTILAPAKRQDVLEVWREKHAPAGQATDLRLLLVIVLFLWSGVGWGWVAQ